MQNCIRYESSVNKFNKIPGAPIAYWISDKLIRPFSNSISIDNISDFTGSQNKTANNEKYLRRIWEVSNEKIGKGKDWVFYIKGGEFRKHYGNIDLVVDWSEKARSFYQNNQTSNLLDNKYWYKEGITYTKITSKGSSFRYLPKDCIFDMAGPSICDLFEKNMYILAFLNSKISETYLKIFNPTLSVQVKDIKSLPLILDINNLNDITEKEKYCVEISQEDWDLFETSWDFKSHPLI